MAIVCLICGDRGLEEALDLCHKCQNYACHRYCQKALPENLYEDMIWLCEDCESDDAKSCTSENACSPESGLKIEQDTTKFHDITEHVCESRNPQDDDDHKLKKRRRLILEEDEDENFDASPSSRPPEPLKSLNILKEKIAVGSLDKPKEKVCNEISVKSVCRETCNSVTKLKQQGDEEETKCGEKSDNGMMLKKKRRLILEDDESQSLDTCIFPASEVGPSNILKPELVTGSQAKMKVQVQENTFASNVPQCVEECTEDEKFGRERESVFEDNEIRDREKCDKDVKCKEKRALFLEDKEGQPVKSSGILSYNVTVSNISQQKLVTGSEAKSKVQLQGSEPSGGASQQLKKRGNKTELGKQRILIPEDADQNSREKRDNDNSVPVQVRHSGDVPQRDEKCNRDQKLNGQLRFIPKHLGAGTVKAPRVAATGQKSSYLSEHKVTYTSVAKGEAQIFDHGRVSCARNKGKCDKDQKLKEPQRWETTEVPVGYVNPSDRESKSQKPKKRRLILTNYEDEFLGKSQLGHNDTGPLNAAKEDIGTGSRSKTTVETPSGKESQCRVRFHDATSLSEQKKSRMKGKEAKDTKPSRVSNGPLKHLHYLGRKFAGGFEAEKSQHTRTRDHNQMLGKHRGSAPEGEGVKHSNAASDIKHSNISRHRVASFPAQKPILQMHHSKPSGVQYRGRHEESTKPRKEQGSILKEEETDTRKTSKVAFGDTKLPHATRQNVDASSWLHGPRPKKSTCISMSSGNAHQDRGKHELDRHLGDRHRVTKVSDTRSSASPQDRAIYGSGDNTNVRISRSRSPVYKPQYEEYHHMDQRPRYQHSTWSNYEQRWMDKQNQPNLGDEDTGSRLEPSSSSEFMYHDPIPVWRGNLSIHCEDFSTIFRFLAVAHLSTSANAQAFDVAKLFPKCIALNVFSRFQLWPKCFQDTGPSSHNIALYFYPSHGRDDFDKLIDYMFSKDLALIAVFEREELVVFTSYVLSPDCQMIKSNYFLWGGFRPRKPSSITDQLKIQQYKKVRD